MKRVSSTVCLLLLLCFVSIWALPLKRNSGKDKKAVPSKPKEQFQLHEQEKELENLAKLQKENADNVLLQTTKDIKVVQENGKKEKVIETAKNVVNADNGDVLSSVRQTIKEENKGNETPKVSAITKVDIPSEGIHNIMAENDLDEEGEFSDDGAMDEKKNMPSIVSSEESDESDESSLDEDIKDLQKSSKVMATYLLETGNFERFEDALRDIVKVGLMTVSEANEYEKIVLEEYERLMALEKIKEYQAKAARSPLDYAEREYDIPYQINNEVDSDEEVDDPINANPYRRRGMLPPPTRGYTGQEYADYPEPIQSYNGYQSEMQADIQDNNEWLNQLLEQANSAGAEGIFDSERFPKTYSSQSSSDEERNFEGDEMMVPGSAVNYDRNQSEESLSALKALAKMDTPAARRDKAKFETKHLAKKLTTTDKKKKKKSA